MFYVFEVILCLFQDLLLLFTFDHYIADFRTELHNSRILSLNFLVCQINDTAIQVLRLNQIIQNIWPIQINRLHLRGEILCIYITSLCLLIAHFFWVILCLCSNFLSLLWYNILIYFTIYYNIIIAVLQRHVIYLNKKIVSDYPVGPGTEDVPLEFVLVLKEKWS